MIKEARGFGATVDEAKEKALSSLNVSEDEDIQFEVISFPKKKTLGLFGGKPAEVRVYVELPEERPKKKPRTQAKNAKPEDIKKTEPKKSADNSEKKKAAGSQHAGAAADAPKSVNAKAKQSEDNASNAAGVQAKQVKPVKSEAYGGFGEAVDASEIQTDSPAGRAVEYLRTILEKLGCSGITFKVAQKENAALIELDGEGISVVIGHRGETLDALQYLTGLAANNGGGYYKVALNIGNYREKREEALTELANRIAAQVLKTGKSRSLEPMNPYERRIIHTAVQNIEGVISGSYGEGSARRVMIAPEGTEIKPLRREPGRRDGGRDRRVRQRKPGREVQAAPAREPKKDSDTPLYGKIN